MRISLREVVFVPPPRRFSGGAEYLARPPLRWPYPSCVAIEWGGRAVLATMPLKEGEAVLVTGPPKDGEVVLATVPPKAVR